MRNAAIEVVTKQLVDLKEQKLLLFFSLSFHSIVKMAGRFHSHRTKL